MLLLLLLLLLSPMTDAYDDFHGGSASSPFSMIDLLSCCSRPHRLEMGIDHK
jgi:hypothetical protein